MITSVATGFLLASSFSMNTAHAVSNESHTESSVLLVSDTAAESRSGSATDVADMGAKARDKHDTTTGADATDSDAKDDDAAADSADGESSGGNTSTQSVAAQAEPTAPVTVRHNRWSIQPAIGAETIKFGTFLAYGPNLRISAWVHKWRGRFMFGGGPAFQYTYLVDNVGSNDKIHLATLNGDFVIGGGRADKFAVFGHMMVAAGVLHAYDGQTDLRAWLPGIRAAAGAGGHYFVTRDLSVGALVDFGYAGGLGIDTLVTAGWHFAPRKK